MKLKSYFAATVEAAMNMARLELGSEAMLVSTTRTAGETRHLGEYEVVFATATHHDARAIDAVGQNQKKAPPIDKLSDEVAGLKHEMERLASALSRSSAGVAKIVGSPDLAEAFSRLVDAELDADVAQDIIWRISSQIENGGNAGSSRCARLMASELQQLFTTDSRLPAPSGRNAIVLVGPPGAGKTTTLVKLAVQYGLGKRRPSQILSVDTHRVAATEPLRSYASIMGLGFRELDSARSLTQALEEHRAKDLIFIDTPGLAHADFEDLSDIAKLLSNHPRVETHLVLSASMKPADMKRITKQYEMFSPSKLIFTHLDETETYGPLINLSIRTGKPISFLSRGQQIPEDLEPAERQTLVRMVLKEMLPSQEELSSTAAA
jgi:flagellar biosynthesis protein FlhF